MASALQGTGLYPRLLGDAWKKLAEPVQQFHSAADQVRGVGSFTVRSGEGLLAQILRRLLRLPVPGHEVPTRLVIARDSNREVWQRRFGEETFSTRQHELAGGLLAERYRFMEFRFRLNVVDHALVFHQVSAALYLGKRRVPLPSWLAPHVAARAGPGADPTRMWVAVRITAPLAGLLVTYEGNLVKEAPAP
jgi:hypothetical protein